MHEALALQSGKQDRDLLRQVAGVLVFDQVEVLQLAGHALHHDDAQRAAAVHHDLGVVQARRPSRQHGAGVPVEANVAEEVFVQLRHQRNL